MGIVGSPTSGHSIFFKIAPQKEVTNLISHLRMFDLSAVAKERERILKFYAKHGEVATKEAFGVGRKTVSVWRKRLRESKGNISSLAPYSTAPKRVRSIQADSRVISFIKSLREAHPRLGKRKIKPILDAYCKEESLKSISEAKVGRIIRLYKLFYQKEGRVYHKPGSRCAQRVGKTRRERVRYAPKPKDFGYIQVDTIVKLVDGVRYYFYSGIDTKGKFALSLPYKTLNSLNTLDFFTKLQYVYPISVKGVQTDNGLEFQGVFDEFLKKGNIPHYFTYPRCPRINGVIERYQRSLKEEFINLNLELLYDPKEFSSKLASYLLFFNTQRVHQGINYMTPMQFLYQKGGMSKKYWSRTIN